MPVHQFYRNHYRHDYHLTATFNSGFILKGYKDAVTAGPQNHDAHLSAFSYSRLAMLTLASQPTENSAT